MNASNRGLDAEALALLLESLDADREAAGEKYVLLRRKLARFFEWRGAGSPEDCADRTLNIAAARLKGGEEVRSLPGYCGGIARMVLLEDRRDAERQRHALATLSAAPAPEADDTADDRRRQAFEECLAELPADSRELILGYYQGDGRERIAARERLAEGLGIPANALRIRAFRIRARLEEALKAAVDGNEDPAKRNRVTRHQKVRVP